MRVEASADTAVLLMLPREKLGFSTSTQAFRIADEPEKKLRSRYCGALVINNKGQVSEISEINVLGYSGETLLRKLPSIVFGIRDIAVQFSNKRQMDLNEFRERAFEFVQWDVETGDPLLEYSGSLEDVHTRLEECSDAADVFRIIGVPEPQDCLDVL